MSTPDFQFQFDGPDAKAEAEALAGFFEKEFADWPSRIEQQAASAPGEAGTRSGDRIALIALIISIPGAVVSAFDLAERIKLKKKFERLIAWARECRARKQRVSTVLRLEAGGAMPLDQAQPHQLLDAITAQAPRKTPPAR